jgi:hypothetical protein
MKITNKRWAATIALALSLLGGVHGPAQADEYEDRRKIGEFFHSRYSAGDFLALDAWYSTALKENTRTPSGIFRANRLVRSIYFEKPQGPATCAAQPCPRVDEAFWLAQQKRAKGWQQQQPQSTLATIVLASTYSYPAWEYRGTGYANTVRKEDMQKFQELNQQALRILLANAEQGRKDPNWWAKVLAVAPHAQIDRKAYARLEQDAIAAFPKNHDIYFSLSTLPQWGGSYKALADLAAQAVENTKAEDGQAFYARIYWNLYSGLVPLNPEPFTHPEVSWPRIRAGFDDLIERYPDGYNINAYARLACIAANDKATTAKIIQQIGQDVVPQVWRHRTEFLRCKSWSQDGDAR